MILSLIVIVLVIVLDQLSKYLIGVHLLGIDSFPVGFENARELQYSGSSFPVIEDVLHFTFVPNRGAAFGMLSNSRWIFMVASIIGILALVVWLFWAKPQSRWAQCAMALIIGGGIGNMIDRVYLQYVVDFIDCKFIDFYVFNVADSCVCVGCAMVILWVIVEEVKEQKAKKAAKASPAVSEGEDE